MLPAQNRGLNPLAKEVWWLPETKSSISCAGFAESYGYGIHRSYFLPYAKGLRETSAQIREKGSALRTFFAGRYVCSNGYLTVARMAEAKEFDQRAYDAALVAGKDHPIGSKRPLFRLVFAAMISAEDALGIADQAARDAGWGEVGEGKRRAGKLSRKSVWHVETKEILIGYSVCLIVDAETGEVVHKERRGPR
jgi:hypothetical protein